MGVCWYQGSERGGREGERAAERGGRASEGGEEERERAGREGARGDYPLYSCPMGCPRWIVAQEAERGREEVESLQRRLLNLQRNLKDAEERVKVDPYPISLRGAWY
eukprot:1530700-Rhodomonas_salina.3